MKCPRCQNENAIGSKYCSECGFDLRALSAAAAAEAGTRVTAPVGAQAAGSQPSDRTPTMPYATQVLPASEAYGAAPSVTQDLPPVAADTSGTERFASPFASQADGQRAYVAAEAPKPPREPLPKRTKAALAAAIAAIVVLAAAAGITYALELWGGKSVPDVVGMTQAKASTELSDAGFSPTVLLVKSDDTEDTVILSDPSAGTRAPEGATVTLHVAQARVVPEIIGMQRDEAEGLMQEEGLENVTYEEVKSNEPEGQVLAVTPEVGEKVTAATAVTVQVAKPYTVPDVAGLSRDEAVALLEAEGYVVDVAQVNTEEVPEGTAVSTDPAADSRLASGQQVTLYLAHNRSTELVDLTRALFEDASSITIGGVSYELRSLGQVTYTGNDVCSYSMVARPFETHNWMFGLGSETKYGNEETITGTVSWTDANRVSAITSSAGDVKVS